MNREIKHEYFCFAGQPAPCKGYFPNDVLPCVCGAEGDAVAALSQVAVPPMTKTPNLKIPKSRMNSRPTGTPPMKQIATRWTLKPRVTTAQAMG